MHVIFIPYGMRSEVELLLRDMEAQKHKFPMWKGKEKKELWIQGAVRLLPLGVYEYVFPKEDLDTVLTTLNFNKDRYLVGKLKLSFLRKMFRAKKAPDCSGKNKYLWMKEHVNIIPLGIREDAETTRAEEPHKGWSHEAI